MVDKKYYMWGDYLKDIMLSYFKKMTALLSAITLLLVCMPTVIAADEAGSVTVYRETFADGK